MQQVEDEGDVVVFEDSGDAVLQGAFAVGDDHPGAVVVGVAAGHLGAEVGDEGVLARPQAGPHPFALRAVTTLMPLVRRGCLLVGLLVVEGEEAGDDVVGGAGTRLLAEHAAHGGHLLVVALLALAPPDGLGSRFGLDHGDALAVDRTYQDEFLRLGVAALGALGVERVEVDAGVDDELFGAALGDHHAGGVGEQGHGGVEGCVHRGDDQPALQFVAVAARGQPELGIEGMETGLPRPAVADAAHRDLAEQGDVPAGVGALAAVAQHTLGRSHLHGRADVAVTARVDVGLQRKAHQLTAALLALALDRSQPQLVGGGCGQPAFQLRERRQRR